MTPYFDTPSLRKKVNDIEANYGIPKLDAACEFHQCCADGEWSIDFYSNNEYADTVYFYETEEPLVSQLRKTLSITEDKASLDTFKVIDVLPFVETIRKARIANQL
jgi:hypothetical protein